MGTLLEALSGASRAFLKTTRHMKSDKGNLFSLMKNMDKANNQKKAIPTSKKRDKARKTFAYGEVQAARVNRRNKKQGLGEGLTTAAKNYKAAAKAAYKTGKSTFGPVGNSEYHKKKWESEKASSNPRSQMAKAKLAGRRLQKAKAKVPQSASRQRDRASDAGQDAARRKAMRRTQRWQGRESMERPSLLENLINQIDEGSLGIGKVDREVKSLRKKGRSRYNQTPRERKFLMKKSAKAVDSGKPTPRVFQNIVKNRKLNSNIGEGSLGSKRQARLNKSATKAELRHDYKKVGKLDKVLTGGLKSGVEKAAMKRWDRFRKRKPKPIRGKDSGVYEGSLGLARLARKPDSVRAAQAKKVRGKKVTGERASRQEYEKKLGDRFRRHHSIGMGKTSRAIRKDVRNDAAKGKSPKIPDLSGK